MPSTLTTTLFILLTTTLLHHSPPLSAAHLHHTTTLHEDPALHTPPPTTYFQVTKPIPHPNTKPCSVTVLTHSFAYTYSKPPVLANYSKPTSQNCPSLSSLSSSSRRFSRIVLEWKATCKGRQFDRIFGVWLSGVELLRSCTAEPRANGIVWTVEKDVTRYYSLLMSDEKQVLAVYLGNLVDSTYTGVYHVNLTFHFYPSGSNDNADDYSGNNAELGADLIVPISRSLPLNDGLWFEVINSTDVQHSNEFVVPKNAYRAVLEVYVSFHENDEFWFGNYPNEYISANNLTGVAGNGPFREVVVSLDDLVIGAVWPFTVIYTGGVNPLLWRPITGIGSFDLPSYDIEVTPLLGALLDGKSHKIGFSVTNALNVWYIDANLHLWIDKKSEMTKGKLLQYDVSPLSLSLLSNFTGFDGKFVTNVSRSISYSGYVESSRGLVMSKSIQDLKYSNVMVMGNDGNMQILDQVIYFNTSVETNMTKPSILSVKSFKKFGVKLYSDNIDKGNRTYDSVSNVTLEFDEKMQKSTDFGIYVSDLKNLQNAQGYMFVKGNLVVSGLGSTQQVYNYNSGKLCYYRNVSSSNYTILHDKESDSCTNNVAWPFSQRRTLLGSTLKIAKNDLI